MTGKLTLELDIDDPRVPGVAAALAGLPATPTPVVIPPVVTPPVIQPSATYRVLTMADGPAITDTVPPTAVTLGTGAHTLTFMVEMRALAAPAGTPFEFDLWLTDENGRHHIASLLRSTGSGWQDACHPNGQRFTLNGDWGASLKALEIVPNGIAWADYIAPQAAFYDGVQLVNALNGSDTYIGLLQGQAGTFAPQAALPPPPPPAPAQVAGDGSIAKLIANAKAGDIITIPAGTYKDSIAINVPITLQGAGIGKTIVDGTGVKLTFGKAIFVPTVPGVVFNDMTIKGAATAPSAGDNGCAIRDNGDGIGYTANRIEVCNCEEGTLTFDSDVTIDGSDFHDNGLPGDAGQTHNMYFGEGGTPGLSHTVKITNTRSTNPLSDHALKSRLGKTIIGNCFLSSHLGRCVDIPEQGVLISLGGNTFDKPVGSEDHCVIAVAAEQANPVAMSASLVNDTIANPNGNEFILLRAGTTLNLDNVKYAGATAPAVDGALGATPGTVTGAFTQKAA